MRDCSKVEPFVVERNYLSRRDLSDVIDMQLHGFSDASGQAYACVIYLRIMFKNGDIRTTFVASKSKVAPIKRLTIPRLELMACVTLSYLMKSIIGSFTDYVISKVYCWTDNTDCMYWINATDKIWGRFIQNRVQEIRCNIPEIPWRHCPGEENPADIPSRGLTLVQPERRQKWLHRPNFFSLLHNWLKNPDTVESTMERKYRCSKC